MSPWLVYILMLFLLCLLIYLLLRLRDLDRGGRGYRWNNQEGIGVWTRGRDPRFLLLALITGLYFLVDWLGGGFQIWDLYLAIITLGLALYAYFYHDDR